LAQFVERFVEFKNFLEQLGRSLLFLFAFLAFAFDFEEILDASERLTQDAIRVI
jgi:hypothetical protein